MPPEFKSWFARLSHDLIKRLLWNARDCRDLLRAPDHHELIAHFIDEQGCPVDVMTLWQALKCCAPSDLRLARFEQALVACVTAAQHDDVDGVLALEGEYQELREQAEALSAGLASSLKERSR